MHPLPTDDHHGGATSSLFGVPPNQRAESSDLQPAEDPQTRSRHSISRILIGAQCDDRPAPPAHDRRSYCSILSLSPRRQMLQLCPDERFLRHGGRGHAQFRRRWTRQERRWAVLSGGASSDPHLGVARALFRGHRVKPASGVVRVVPSKPIGVFDHDWSSPRLPRAGRRHRRR